MQEQVNPFQKYAHAYHSNDSSEMTLWPLLENKIEKSHYYILSEQTTSYETSLRFCSSCSDKIPQQSNLKEKGFT